MRVLAVFVACLALASATAVHVKPTAVESHQETPHMHHHELEQRKQAALEVAELLLRNAELENQVDRLEKKSGAPTSSLLEVEDEAAPPAAAGASGGASGGDSACDAILAPAEEASLKCVKKAMAKAQAQATRQLNGLKSKLLRHLTNAVASATNDDAGLSVSKCKNFLQGKAKRLANLRNKLCPAAGAQGYGGGPGGAGGMRGGGGRGKGRGGKGGRGGRGRGGGAPPKDNYNDIEDCEDAETDDAAYNYAAGAQGFDDGDSGDCGLDLLMAL